MTDTKNHMAAIASLEGRVFRPTTAAEVAEAVDLALDYRGDVTVELVSGETVVGYIYNRSATGPNPCFDMFPADNPAPQQIAYSAIASIAFTGEDTANGKSWESWVSKKESERRVESDRVAAEAKARGHL